MLSRITKITDEEWFPRVFPFAIFMAFIGLEDGFTLLASGKDSLSWLLTYDRYIYYPIKTLAVLCALYLLRNRYTEVVAEDLLRFKTLAAGAVTGIIVFILWISLDWDFATQFKPDPFNPSVFSSHTLNKVNILFRLAGSSLVVPVFEEIFWRSFLIRYVINPNFTDVPLAAFTWPSFIVSSVLFALEHNLWLAGLAAGIIYNLLLYTSKNLMTVIFAHMVTNLILGIYIILSGSWQFW